MRTGRGRCAFSFRGGCGCNRKRVVGCASPLTAPRAPLDQVIYHLNSKGEDHDLQLADTADAYEGEIDTILSDAASRISRFKAALERERQVQGVGEGWEVVCVEESVCV